MMGFIGTEHCEVGQEAEIATRFLADNSYMG
jgi:hypothetical protein